MAFATPQEVADELGRAPFADPTEVSQVLRWLTRAENQIRARISDLNARAEDPDYRALVVDVEVAAVARVARNPEGLRSVMTSVDDGSTTKTRDSALSDGQMRILDDEWDLLLPATSPDAFSSPVSYVPGWHRHPLSAWGRP